MLVLGDHQIQKFQRQRWREVRDRIAVHLRYNFADDLSRQYLTGDALLSPLDQALSRARDLGFTSERDLRIFAEACAVLDFSFPRTPEDDALAEALPQAESSAARAELVDHYLIWLAADAPG